MKVYTRNTLVVNIRYWRVIKETILYTTEFQFSSLSLGNREYEYADEYFLYSVIVICQGTGGVCQQQKVGSIPYLNVLFHTLDFESYCMMKKLLK